MRNYYAPGFNRIVFVVIPSDIELPCSMLLFYRHGYYFRTFVHPEAAAQRCSIEMFSFKISQNSQENNCNGVLFLGTLLEIRLHCT